MKHWRLKNKPYETFDDTRDRLGIKLYKVKVEINDTQFWEVEAESEQGAMDNYMEGSHHHTNSHGEDVEVMEEITERKS